jgi:hypothetical protein
MNFSNDNTMFVTQKWKTWNKKITKVMSKEKLKNKTSTNEKFISEVHWNFPNFFIFYF